MPFFVEDVTYLVLLTNVLPDRILHLVALTTFSIDSLFLSCVCVFLLVACTFFLKCSCAQSESELNSMLRLLPLYADHVSRRRGSLITRFYGIYRITNLRNSKCVSIGRHGCPRCSYALSASADRPCLYSDCIQSGRNS